MYKYAITNVQEYTLFENILVKVFSNIIHIVLTMQEIFMDV